MPFGIELTGEGEYSKDEAARSDYLPPRRKYSQATEAEVRVEFGHKAISVSVSDNGRGFKPPQTLGDLARMGKLGLIGMQERARLVGGSLLVKSEHANGTTVIVEIPC